MLDVYNTKEQLVHVAGGMDIGKICVDGEVVWQKPAAFQEGDLVRDVCRAANCPYKGSIGIVVGYNGRGTPMVDFPSKKDNVVCPPNVLELVRR